MFVEGFEKTSSLKNLKRENEKKKRQVEAFGQMAAPMTAAALSVPALVGGAVLSQKSDGELAQKIKKDMLSKYKLNVDFETVPHSIMSHYKHPHWGHKKAPSLFGAVKEMASHGSVAVPSNPDPAILAHELGHAAHLGPMKKWHSKLHVYGRSHVPLLGLGIGAGLLRSDDKEKRKWAPAAVLAGATPLLYQEGRATAHALAALKRVGGTKAMLKGLRTLAPAGLTYAAMPLGTAYGFHRAAKYLNNKPKKEGKK